jgi:hypothetical protein
MLLQFPQLVRPRPQFILDRQLQLQLQLQLQ